VEEKQWFLYVVDHHEGPFTILEIKELLNKGEARTSSYVWKEGLPDWIVLSSVSEFDVEKTPIIAQASLVQADVSTSSGIWCLNSHKTYSGPHSIKTIVRKINNGEVLPNDLVWKEGWTSFVEIKKIQEFAQLIDPELLAGNKSSKKTKASFSKTLSYYGVPTAQTKRWYQSRFLYFFIFCIFVGSIYYSFSTGKLDVVLEKISLKERVATFKLPQLPQLSQLPIPTQVSEYFLKLLPYVPDFIKLRVLPIQLPSGLSDSDQKNLLEAAFTPLKNGAKTVSAMPLGEEKNPSFIIVSNLPEGTSLQVALRGKKGTLLKALKYEKAYNTEIINKISKTPRFIHEKNQPLPLGDYHLFVYVAPNQPPAVQSVLSKLPKKITPQVEIYFLGGKKDTTYFSQLKEFNEVARKRFLQEYSELKQLSLTIEGMANESATRFFSLSRMLNPKNKNEWEKYHLKYNKMSVQIQNVLEKKNVLDFPDILAQIRGVFELTKNIHQLQTNFMKKSGTTSEVQSAASKLVQAMQDLKHELVTKGPD